MAEKDGASAFSYIKPDGTLGTWTNAYTLPPDIAGPANKTASTSASDSTFDPFSVYKTFAPYGYENKKAISETLDSHKKYMEWMNSPMFVEARMNKIRKKIDDYTMSRKAPKIDKFRYGYDSVDHWWGFPILDTLVRPIYAFFKGLNYTRKSYDEFGTRLLGDYTRLKEHLASTKPKEAPKREMIDVAIRDEEGNPVFMPGTTQPFTAQVPKKWTFEDFKDPYFRYLVGLPAMEQAQPARAGAGAIDPNAVMGLLRNLGPDGYRQLGASLFGGAA